MSIRPIRLYRRVYCECVRYWFCLRHACFLTEQHGWLENVLSDTRCPEHCAPVLSMRGHYCCKSVAVNPLSGRYGASRAEIVL